MTRPTLQRKETLSEVHGMKNVKDRRRSMPEINQVISVAHLNSQRSVGVRQREAESLEKRIAEKRLEMKHKTNSATNIDEQTDAVADFLAKAAREEETTKEVAPEPPVSDAVNASSNVKPPPPPPHVLQALAAKVPEHPVQPNLVQQQQLMQQQQLLQQQQLMQQQQAMSPYQMPMPYMIPYMSPIPMNPFPQGSPPTAAPVQPPHQPVTATAPPPPPPASHETTSNGTYEHTSPTNLAEAHTVHQNSYHPSAQPSNIQEVGKDAERTLKGLQRKLKMSSALHGSGIPEDEKTILVEKAKEALRTDLGHIIKLRDESNSSLTTIQTPYDDVKGGSTGLAKLLDDTLSRRDKQVRSYLEDEVTRLREENGRLIADKAGLLAENSKLQTLADRAELILSGKAQIYNQISNMEQTMVDKKEKQALSAMVEKLRESNRSVMEKNSDLEVKLAEERARNVEQSLALQPSSTGSSSNEADLMKEITILKGANDELNNMNSQHLERRLELEALHTENGQLSIALAESKKALEEVKLEKDKMALQAVALEQKAQAAETMSSTISELQREIERLSISQGLGAQARLGKVEQLEQEVTMLKLRSAEQSPEVSLRLHSEQNGDNGMENGSNQEQEEVGIVDLLMTMASSPCDYMRIERNRSGLTALSPNDHVLFSDLAFRTNGFGDLEKIILVITERSVDLLTTGTNRRSIWHCPLIQLMSLHFDVDDGDEHLFFKLITGEEVSVQSPRRETAVGMVLKMFRKSNMKFSPLIKGKTTKILRDFS